MKVKGVCTRCPPGSYYDSYSDQCLCKPGYIKKSGFCQPICPSDQTYINNRCSCNNGLPIVNGQCKKIDLCPPNAYFDKGADCCLCNPGYQIIDGRCDNYIYCGVNGYLRYGKCYCNNGYFWILGECRPCGQN